MPASLRANCGIGAEASGETGPSRCRWQRKGRFRFRSRAFGGPSRKQARERHSRQGGKSWNQCTIRKSCTTCMHRFEDDEECQMCKLTGVSVDGIDLCSGWKMAEGYQQAGRKRGKIKKKEYLMFVQMQREQEHKAIKQGILKEEECKTSEELRAMYEEEFGNIYIN